MYGLLLTTLFTAKDKSYVHYTCDYLIIRLYENVLFFSVYITSNTRLFSKIYNSGLFKIFISFLNKFELMSLKLQRIDTVQGCLFYFFILCGNFPAILPNKYPYVFCKLLQNLLVCTLFCTAIVIYRIKRIKMIFYF